MIKHYNTIPIVIELFGEMVEVVTRTPQKDKEGEIIKNRKGRIIYDETTYTIKARIIENKTTESLWNQTIQQKTDAMGLFNLQDNDKLNENSRVIYHDQIYYMKKPAKRITGIEVPLNKKEV